MKDIYVLAASFIEEFPRDDETRNILKAYYDGRRFWHGEAYQLCAIALLMPRSYLNDKGIVIVEFRDVATPDCSNRRRQELQVHMRDQGRVVATRAAKSLKIDLHRS